jgi:hypothetical protein
MFFRDTPNRTPNRSGSGAVKERSDSDIVVLGSASVLGRFPAAGSLTLERPARADGRGVYVQYDLLQYRIVSPADDGEECAALPDRGFVPRVRRHPVELRADVLNATNLLDDAGAWPGG